MKFLKKLIRKKEFESGMKAVDALKTFTHQFYFGEALTQEQTQKNLESGIVELIWPNGKHCSNGLLITENGYFVTCEHCLNGNSEEQKIRNHKGNIYEIERVLVTSRKNDLALVKAAIPEEAVPRSYKFLDYESAESREIVALFGRRDGEIYKKYGYVNGALEGESIEMTTGKLFAESQIRYDLEAKKGDSGGHHRRLRKKNLRSRVNLRRREKCSLLLLNGSRLWK